MSQLTQDNAVLLAKAALAAGSTILFDNPDDRYPSAVTFRLATIALFLPDLVGKEMKNLSEHISAGTAPAYLTGPLTSRTLVQQLAMFAMAINPLRETQGNAQRRSLEKEATAIALADLLSLLALDVGMELLPFIELVSPDAAKLYSLHEASMEDAKKITDTVIDRVMKKSA